MARVEEVQPDGAAVVVYCHHGVRSLSGAAILGRAGIEALSLAGGIDRWALTVDPSVPRY
jgi:rhodanese-related sulfurtransferase